MRAMNAAPEKPRASRTIEEERYCGMGQALAIIDMARELVPPPNIAPVDALRQYAQMAEDVVSDYYGKDDWKFFVAKCRASAGEH